MNNSETVIVSAESTTTGFNIQSSAQVNVKKPRGRVIYGNGGDAQLCQICSAVSNGFHFGVLVCRACAAFFRRTVVENKTYRCKQEAQCEISKEQRNMCRACRFQRCEQLGMKRDGTIRPSFLKRIEKIDENVLPIIQPKSYASTTSTQIPILPELFTSQQPPHILGSLGTGTNFSVNQQTSAFTAPHSSNNFFMPKAVDGQSSSAANLGDVNANVLGFQAPAFAIIPCSSLSANTSVLQRMLDGYRSFQSSQKSLHIVMYPSNIFAGESEENYRLTKYTEYVRMERGCLSLMYSLLNDSFQPFNMLSQSLKMDILKAFVGRFTHLDQCYKSGLVFPGDNDPRLVLHYGQYMDSNKLEDFFCDDKDPLSSARVSKPISERFKNVVRKMKAMKIREIEIAALAGIILWNEVANMNVKDTDKIRSAIFSDLHNNIILTYGIAATGVRLGSLLDFIHDFNLIEKEISESDIISKLFNPHLQDVW